MSELAVIETSPGPVTFQRLVADLRLLGVGEGETVIAHVSMSLVSDG